MGGKDSKPVFVTYEEALDRGISYMNIVYRYYQKTGRVGTRIYFSSFRKWLLRPLCSAKRDSVLCQQNG